MVEQDLQHLTLDGYLLGSTEGRCVCFYKERSGFNKIDISHHCKEQDLEICAVQLETKICKLY
jgi:hypothetical protein